MGGRLRSTDRTSDRVGDSGLGDNHFGFRKPPRDLSAEPLDRVVGRISLDAKFYPPNRQRRDLDNCLKVMIDAIQASGIILNDFQIKKLSAEMFEPIPNGGAIVELCEIPEPFTLF